MSEQYVVIKTVRGYDGGLGYSGPSCKDAGVIPNFIYSSKECAEKDAVKLTEVNPVGFSVVLYYKRSVDEYE